jgi:hypothetical protein
VTRPSPEPARLLANRVVEADLVARESDDVDSEFGGEEGVPGVSMTFAILAAWIIGARQELATADLAVTVLNWITTHPAESADSDCLSDGVDTCTGSPVLPSRSGTPHSLGVSHISLTKREKPVTAGRPSPVLPRSLVQPADFHVHPDPIAG